MSGERFLYLWQADRPTEGVKIHLLGDPELTDKLEEWAGEDVVFMATISRPPVDNPAQMPLFGNAAIYDATDRDHPGGN